MATDYSKPLHNWDVEVQMVRRAPDEEAEFRWFRAIIPADSHEAAIEGAKHFGYAIGMASHWQWKFNGSNEQVNVALIAPEENLPEVALPEGG